MPSLFLLFCSFFFLPAFPSFPQRNFELGSPRNDDRQLRRPLASPVLWGALPIRPRRASLCGYCAVVRTPLHRSEEHTSELQSQSNIVCRLLLEKKNPRSVSPTATR